MLLYNQVIIHLAMSVLKYGFRSHIGVLAHHIGIRNCVYWIWHIKLDWSAMCCWISPSQGDQMVKMLIQKYADVFKTEQGVMKDIKSKLILKAGVVPTFITT